MTAATHSESRGHDGGPVRNLILILGDQLDPRSAAFDGLDRRRDVLWMAENETEATHVWCHKRRLVLFFAAMRHFRHAREAEGLRVDYHALQVDRRHDSGRDFAAIVRASVRRLHPERLIVVEPGDWRVRDMLTATAAALDLPIDIRHDRHFYCRIDEFNDWAEGRNRLVLEDFYRHMRRSRGILMDGDRPACGSWNFDHKNRDSFGRDGPGRVPAPKLFEPDALTRDVIALVEQRYADHPGELASFDQPVTRAQARRALDDFLEHRLAHFGQWQDALWTDEPLLYHSGVSAALNMHLLDPRECVEAAVAAWRDGRAPIASVEGFVRQILGWREFVRGVYWRHMPAYIDNNALDADLPVPPAYWHGDTAMRCVHECMRNVVRHAYAHHIQRLMVLGLFAQLAGVHPRVFHDWHMAMYRDAIDWVSLPNALGMSQYADGGLLGTKPYCASGNYINRMSNYCRNCAFDYKKASGESACPFTTLYWDFLDRHAEKFKHNRRMAFQMRNLERKRDKGEMPPIRKQAADLRQLIGDGKRL
jgi:deoxyribodipyrimidine photolyase-related protein